MKISGACLNRSGFKYALYLPVFAIFVALHIVAQAATQPQIDDARNRAAAWLIKKQTGAGNWNETSTNDIAASAQATKSLYKAGVRGYTIFNAQNWLANAEPASVDALSRTLLAKTDGLINYSQKVALLQSWKNMDQGATVISLWGTYSKYSTTIPDTSIAWRALLKGNYAYAGWDVEAENMVCQVLAGQQASGAWTATLPSNTNPGFTTTWSASGSILATTQAVLMLSDAKNTFSFWATHNCPGKSGGEAAQIDAAVNNAITWLTSTVKNVDGGIGEDGKSYAVATAQVLQVLLQVNPAHPSVQMLLNYMLPQQNAAGDWGGSVFATATMLENLGGIASLDIDTDGDGVPNAIEIALGTNPFVQDIGPSTNTISAQPGQPGINSPVVVATATLGKPYGPNALSVSGGVAPYVWSLAAAAPPPGLILSSAGVISGTPTALGVYPFQALVQDSQGRTAQTLVQITVMRPLALGDVNGDGKVDLADYILAQKIFQGIVIPTQQQLEQLDVAPANNPDGVIDGADLARLLRKILGTENF